MALLCNVPPYVVALTCLFWVGSLIGMIVCVVKVPETQASVFYLMTIDVVLTMAKYVVLIVLTDLMLDCLLSISVCIIRREKESRDAAQEYYIAGKKAVEEETSLLTKTSSAYLSVISKMDKHLDMMLIRASDAHKLLVNRFESSAQSDANASTPRETPVSGASEEGFVINASEIKRVDSVSEEGSSTRSAALTA
jgi:hypothetical protein